MTPKTASFALPLMVSTLMLGGCITTLSAPGTANGFSGVTPSLAVPDEGWHPQVSASGSVLRGDGESGSGTAGMIEGGLLWQTGLKSDWSLGGFASIQSRLLMSQVKLSPNEAEETITADERRTLSAQGTDFDAGAAIRVGLVSKGYVGTLSLYYQAVAQYETGSHFDQRRAADDIGRYFNFASERLSWGIGPGIDLAFGSAGKWSFGGSLDFIGIRNRTQSYVDTDTIDDGSYSGTEVDITRAGGKPYVEVMSVGRIYLDIQNYRVFWSVGGSDGGDSKTLGFSYRW